eukprot:7644125-Pyramimonas_sp.AAC.2
MELVAATVTHEAKRQRIAQGGGWKCPTLRQDVRGFLHLRRGTDARDAWYAYETRRTDVERQSNGEVELVCVRLWLGGVMGWMQQEESTCKPQANTSCALVFMESMWYQKGIVGDLRASLERAKRECTPTEVAPTASIH